MAEAVKAQGLTPERFMEIGKSENPASSNVNAAEQEKFQKALAQVKKIIEEDKVKKQEAVQTAGLNIEQFNEMAQAIRKDPALQEQVRKLLSK
jgi:phosphoenolpyruvate-protein kinase (PTS system EI component)